MNLPPGLVVVTGAGGFIGGNLTNYLERCGVPTAGLYHNSPLPPPGPNRISPRWAAQMDMLKFTDIQSPNLPILAMVNLAQSVGTNNVEDTEYVAQSLQMMGNVIRASAVSSIPCLITMSSCAVYGNAQSQDQKLLEDGPVSPLSAYGKAKLHTEMMTTAIASSVNQKVFTLRLPSVVGWNISPGSLVSMSVASAHGKGRVLLNGVNSRSWISVEDLCSLIGKIIERHHDFPVGHHIFNVGTSTVLSQIGVFKRVEEQLNRIVSYEVAERPAYEMRRMVPSTAKIENFFGPVMQDINCDAGFRDAISYVDECFKPLKT